ncbi:DUF6625 family protein [Bifidobacterium adolescentis]|jgi:hypothetical protein|uniref:DUF6625 family protein n=1 Tax=Bifidobacterium adolescentis TaxID=1680 RepID=UPI001C215B50|nr:DUF6625 family protein [Bifidobacterium adolescentis]MBU9011249.1 hypothetical protein [Bifidobacterium adolescentis]MBU9080782.1 hypothetical protein [Bifidobacterium adolescentis]MBU9102218.1 hypothetical protein [Bifidobacterium adolescentis]MBU9104103.1 hypothetical protein [Bifidobacterium adolescentis]
MKKCVLILPYFGKFNNYFPLFLKSCGYNPSYDFLIFTDNTDFYNYPQNVHVVPMTLNEFRANASQKLGFEPCIPTAYKLCDFKPAYGFLFEDYIQDYEYWGHCDCDLVFGNLEKVLSPVLDKDYDKIFAAGHLTIYKNTFDNNRRFMKSLEGREIYREAFTTSRIYVFDENVRCSMNPDRLNVHTLFRDNDAKIYEKDLSFNVSPKKAKITRTAYNPQTQKFEEDHRYANLARYYLCADGLLVVSWNKDHAVVNTHQYLYMHLQSRRMRMSAEVVQSPVVEIRPDRFVRANRLPSTKAELANRFFNVFNYFWIDTYIKKFKAKLANIF